MKVFVLGVPHTQTRTEFSTCAFTMKVWNLCGMLVDRGHEVIHLGVGGSNPRCTTNINVVPEAVWRKRYGHPGNAGYDLTPKPDYDALYAAAARVAILDRCSKPYEAIICCPWGGAQQTAVTGLEQFVVESGIGYEHTWAPYRIFESYAHMHKVYGKLGFTGDRWYDAVIPNAFDPDMFRFEHSKQPYLLYLGRLNDDKGVQIAVDVARITGHELVLAGQGDATRFPGTRYVGAVGIDARRELLAGAKALLCPTRYLEPFGGVAVEAQLSGTPVVCTDWGAFPETVLHGTTGFRCRTMEHFVWAVRNIDAIEPARCRAWAVENFSLARIGQMYDEHFSSILALNGAGWDSSRDSRRELSWLGKNYPCV